MKAIRRLARIMVCIVFFLAFVSPQISWAQRYQVQDDLGQTNIDQAYMDSQVRSCVGNAATSSELSDCAGLFSDACMDEDASWGQSTLGIFFCVEAETAVWDALIKESSLALSVRYKELDDLDEDGALSLPLRVPSLKEAQKLWEEARDADCLVEYLRWRGGTGAKILGAHCRLERTSQRAIWLRTLLEEN